MKRTALGFLLCLQGFSSACATIQFSESDHYREESTLDVWHSAVAAGFVEWSDPIDLAGACRNKTFRSLTSELTLGANFLGNTTFRLWTPIDVSILCE